MTPNQLTQSINDQQANRDRAARSAVPMYAPGDLAAGVYHPTARWIEFLASGPQSCVCQPDSDMKLVAVTGPAGDAQSQRDADLFAAAPAMLRACKCAVAFLNTLDTDEWPPALDKVLRDAIKTATGESVG